jgi:hypothetical protein
MASTLGGAVRICLTPQAGCGWPVAAIRPGDDTPRSAEHRPHPPSPMIPTRAAVALSRRPPRVNHQVQSARSVEVDAVRAVRLAPTRDGAGARDEGDRPGQVRPTRRAGAAGGRRAASRFLCVSRAGMWRRYAAARELRDGRSTILGCRWSRSSMARPSGRGWRTRPTRTWSPLRSACPIRAGGGPRCGCGGGAVRL